MKSKSDKTQYINSEKTYFSFWLSVIIIIVISCGVYTSISSSADAETDFTKYKSFAWLPDHTDTNNLPHNNEIIRNNIRNYFGKSFVERGYTLDLDTPDVLLRLIIDNKKKEKTEIYYSYPYYYGRYYYGSVYYYPYKWDHYYRHHYAYHPWLYSVEHIHYVEGSITLNVIDRVKNKLVWTGTAKGDIYDPSYIDRSIHPAVLAIMNRYPIKEIKGGKFSDDNYN